MTATTDRQPEDAELTIDQLAARVGLTVRTVRFYTGKKLLPPPRLEGRTGFYGPQHVARLSLVRDLQQAGYTLAAIEQFLGTLSDDADTTSIEMLGALLVPWVPQPAMVLSVDELGDQLGRPVDGELIDLLEAAHVLEVRGGGKVALSQTQLEYACRMLALDAPMGALLEASRIIQHHSSAMAGELQQVFRERIMSRFDAEDPQNRAQLRTIGDGLRQIAINGIVTAFQEALAREVRTQAER